MKLKLYNSLTKSVEDFTPINSVVRFYSCGPTVYDNAHIGNLSSFIFADTLRRVLELAGFKVEHVMNITDVDDKTIKRSKHDYPDDAPEVALRQLTSLYETRFKEDLGSVGNDIKSLNFIKATDSIDIIQKLTLDLVKNGFAYIADDGIYFSIEAYQKDNKKYGQLITVDFDKTKKARIENDEYDKESASDFALWKLMKLGEPAWTFEIDGKDYLGRPGWHIECSAMSTNKLGQPFDIHSGGIDLIFPHHENEIAQSTAGKTNPIYAKFFTHNNHLKVDERKMSKSLGNIYNLEDVISRGYSPSAFRLLILQSHYRSEANFSWELLNAATARLNDLHNLVALKHQIKQNTQKRLPINETKDKIIEALLNDINTPKALAAISEFQNVAQEELVREEQLDEFNRLVRLIDGLFSLKLSHVKDISDEQKSLIKQREDARDKKDWAESDSLRDKLISEGIGVRDTKLGPVWQYLND